MKLLFATGAFPYPPHDGERLRSFHLLRALSIQCEIDLVTFYDSKDEFDAGLGEVERYCRSVQGIKRPSPSKLNLVTTAIQGKPLFLARNASTEFRNALASLSSRSLYDAVHIDGLPMAQYVNLFQGAPVPILDLRDAWSILYDRKFQKSKGIEKLKWWLRRLAVHSYEGHIVREHRHMVLLSKEDRSQLIRFWPEASHIELVPNGVDTTYFCPQDVPETTGLIAFSGAMGYGPNADAAEYFIRDVLPLIRKCHPAVHFRVVGRDPSPRLLGFASDTISFTGYVDDVRPYLSEAQVIVCPLLSGAGIKNKVLEAMALARPSVVSTIAAEGVGAEHGNHFLIADDAASIARAVIDLLNDAQARRNLGGAARDYVEQNFSWAASAASFMALYRSVNDGHVKGQGT